MEGDILKGMTKNLHSIVYITASKLFWYGEHFSSLMQQVLPQDIMSDLEIMDPDKLAVVVGEFLLHNNVKEGEITVILSTEVTFEKEFIDDNALKDGLILFLDQVPFEKVAHRVYYVNKKIKVVAVNQEYCMALRHILIEARCIPTAFIPFTILQDTLPELQSGIDLRIMLAKLDVIRQYNLFVEEDASQNITRTTKQTNEKNRLYLLIGMFGLLLTVLVIVFIVTLR